MDFPISMHETELLASDFDPSGAAHARFELQREAMFSSFGVFSEVGATVARIRLHLEYSVSP